MPLTLLMMMEYVVIVERLHASCTVKRVILLLFLVGLLFSIISSLPPLDNCLPAEKTALLPLRFEHVLSGIADSNFKVNQRLGPLEKIDHVLG